MLIHPFDNVDVIAGQGTAAIELLEDVPELDVVIAPIGGGGLLSGTAIAAKRHASGHSRIRRRARERRRRVARVPVGTRRARAGDDDDRRRPAFAGVGAHARRDPRERRGDRPGKRGGDRARDAAGLGEDEDRHRAFGCGPAGRVFSSGRWTSPGRGSASSSPAAMSISTGCRGRREPARDEDARDPLSCLSLEARRRARAGAACRDAGRCGSRSRPAACVPAAACAGIARSA